MWHLLHLCHIFGPNRKHSKAIRNTQRQSDKAGKQTKLTKLTSFAYLVSSPSTSGSPRNWSEWDNNKMIKRQFEDHFKLTERLLPLRLHTKGVVTKDSNKTTLWQYLDHRKIIDRLVQAPSLVSGGHESGKTKVRIMQDQGHMIVWLFLVPSLRLGCCEPQFGRAVIRSL